MDNPAVKHCPAQAAGGGGLVAEVLAAEAMVAAEAKAAEVLATNT